MDKSEPRWKQAALVATTIGIGILLNGQVGHADQATAGMPAQQESTQQQAAPQENGAGQPQTQNASLAQENAVVLVRAAQGSATIPGKPVYGDVPKWQYTSGNLHQPWMDAMKQNISTVEQQKEKEENEYNTVHQQSVLLQDKYDQEYKQGYNDVYNNPQAHLQVLPQELQDEFRLIYKQIEAQQKIMDDGTKTDEERAHAKSTLARLQTERMTPLMENKIGPYFSQLVKQKLSGLQQQLDTVNASQAQHYNKLRQLDTELQNLKTEYGENIYTVRQIRQVVTRTIQINFPDRATQRITQTATINGTQTTKNNQVTYQWDTASWPKYTPLFYFGYQCDVNEVPSVAVNEKTPNQTLTVSYYQQAELNTNYNHFDHGNYAYLDHYQLVGDQLQVSGWHATNDARNKPYHYLILFDNTTHKEVTRLLVGQTVRKDIAAIYNVYGAALSGFQAALTIPASILTSSDNLVLISRYTDDQAGNNNPTDYWFNGLRVDQGNHGWLDIMQVRNGQLHVAGWHATNQAASRHHHVLILFDASRGREIARVDVTTVNRSDVASVYPMVGNAGTAGYAADFSITPAMSTDELQIISRYSSQADANSDYVDYWSSPRHLTTDMSNQGWLDNVSVQGNQLHIVGWHATNQSLGRRYHTVIVLNAKTGRELARSTTDRFVRRDDLVRAFPNILTAQSAGFDANIRLTTAMADQPLQIISRYSTTADANMDYVDYWFAPLANDTGNYGYLDNFSIQNDRITVHGWHATNAALGRSYHTIIILDARDGHEISRQTVDPSSRADVARAFPRVLNAGTSGFSAELRFNPAMVTDPIQIISRWSATVDANSDYVDYWFPPVQLLADRGNYGNLDKLSLVGNQVQVTGWHASNQAFGKSYHWIILFDQTQGQEVGRGLVKSGAARPDVAKVYPHVSNAINSGYNVVITPHIDVIHGDRLQVVSRWTNDPAGNGDGTDYWFAPRVLL